MDIFVSILEGLVAAIFIILAAWIAAVWTYFCPRRNRQIGLAVALEQKAYEWMRVWIVVLMIGDQSIDDLMKSWKENETITLFSNQLIDKLRVLYSQEKYPLTFVNHSKFIHETLQGELPVLRNKDLLRALYRFDESEQGINVALEWITSEKFAQLSDERKESGFHYFSDKIKPFTESGINLLFELSKYIEVRNNRKWGVFCGKW